MRKVVVFFCMFMIFSGCAGLAPKSPEEIVAERAQQRIDALMAGDYEGSYQFTTPGYRSTEGVGRYGTRWSGVGMWISAAVKKVDCSGGEQVDRCRVAVEVTYKAPKYEATTTYLSEDWLLIEGEWYLYQNIGE